MYQALYRKYRPLDFDSVIGQNGIVNNTRFISNTVVSYSILSFKEDSFSIQSNILLHNSVPEQIK